MLVVQAMLFVWVVSRPVRRCRASPDRFAQTVAVDVGEALRARSVARPRRVPPRPVRPRRASVLRAARGRPRVRQSPAAPFSRTVAGHGARAAQRGLPGDGARRFASADRRQDRRTGSAASIGRTAADQPDRPPGTGFRPMRPAPIIVGDELAGVVVVLPRAPFWFLLARYAPTLALVAVGALVVGTLLATRGHLRPGPAPAASVEEAARRLGGGDLTARAPAQRRRRSDGGGRPRSTRWPTIWRPAPSALAAVRSRPPSAAGRRLA